MADKSKFVVALEKTPEGLAAITAVGIKEIDGDKITIKEGISDAELQWRIGQPAVNQMVIDNEEEPATKYDVKVTFTGCTCVCGETSVTSGTPFEVEDGSEITLTFTPTEGYELDTFTVDGETATLTENAYTTTVDKDLVIVATYVEQTPNPEPNPDENN